MSLIVGIFLWILFFFTLEQVIVRSIKRANREIKEEDKESSIYHTEK